ncbi:antibiotic resistance protein VanZ [Leptotrichia sp. oral taxon 847]|uniref:antibiotic resistance protein VanZ n=1 Tax=Leptotrichia sp. oral taxon 847 TaxID=1785996 RepID=UPI0007682ADB|nr:antibiotic resistance protein VanZ [Leptotrichia sp. oral taxon 847]AMD94414.1 antibiotic resistance protein VanZ [Leptotrichia sp. oral taxon 847]
MSKIIVRDKFKFRLFPKTIWIDNEKKKLKPNSEIIFETNEDYVILSEKKSKKRKLGLDLENKEEVVVEIKYNFFILSMIFLVPVLFVIIILIFNLDEIDAKQLGTVVGILIHIMFLKIEKFEIVSK